MKPGVFITFEGGEGVGKTTQIKLISEKLTKKNIKHITTREPGGTDTAEEIRKILVSGDKNKLSPLAETLLNYAARDNHLQSIIKPAIAEGKWVLCDRFFDSTIAYQGIAGGVDRDFITNLNKHVVGTNIPNLTFIMDMDYNTGLKRSYSRNSQTNIQQETRFEAKGQKYHNLVRKAFLDIHSKNPNRCCLINAETSIIEINSLIWDKIKTLYNII